MVGLGESAEIAARTFSVGRHGTLTWRIGTWIHKSLLARRTHAHTVRPAASVLLCQRIQSAVVIRRTIILERRITHKGFVGIRIFVYGITQGTAGGHAEILAFGD